MVDYIIGIKIDSCINTFQIRNIKRDTQIESIMAGLGTNIADAFVDNAVDKVANAFIPGDGKVFFHE